MIERTQGIILRTRLLTETSLIVHWLTSESGRIATVAKGARRPKSPFRGKLDVFYEAEFSFARSRRSDLHALCEVSLIRTHPRLREELTCLRQAAYAAALIEQTTETETPLPGCHRLFCDFLATVAEPPASPNGIFAFEFRLLEELGLQPDAMRSTLSPGTRAAAMALATLDWGAVRRLQLSPGQAAELRQYLHGLLIYHLDRLPEGRAAALATGP